MIDLRKKSTMAEKWLQQSSRQFPKEKVERWIVHYAEVKKGLRQGLEYCPEIPWTLTGDMDDWTFSLKSFIDNQFEI